MRPPPIHRSTGEIPGGVSRDQVQRAARRVPDRTMIPSIVISIHGETVRRNQSRFARNANTTIPTANPSKKSGGVPFGFVDSRATNSTSGIPANAVEATSDRQ